MKWVKGSHYQIIYLDQNNQITARHIKVIQEHDYTLLAFCFEKKGIRTFLKEGILGFTKVPTHSDWVPSRDFGQSS